MNQLTWRFGFALENYVLPADETNHYLFDNDNTDLADEYAEVAVKYLLKKINDLSVKANDTVFLKWLGKVFEVNADKILDKNDFTHDVKNKLWLLIRGHISELKSEKWFKNYLYDPEQYYYFQNEKIDNSLVSSVFDYSWSEMKDTWRKKLMSATGIQVCPYCDRQYITSFYDAKEKLYATSELDHFYSQMKYPLFSLSLFNFIPSCHICNLYKNAKPLKVYPYSDIFEDKTHFVLIPLASENIETESGTESEAEAKAIVDMILGKKDSDFNIEQVTCTAVLSKEESDSIHNDVDVLKLNEIYSGHKDYVLDLITIRRFYENSEYRSSIENLLNSTVFSNSSVKYPVTIEKLRLFMIGGDWIHENKSDRIPHKRPLAKLTSAILSDDYTDLIKTR